METNTNTTQISIDEDTAEIRHTQKIIEAILFAAGHPVAYTKLADVLEKTPAQVKKIVHAYAEEYNREDSPLPRGIMMLCFPEACQLCTMEQYGQYIREALGIRRGGNLSASSIEVLAIVAYNEPVTRAYIDTVRGVDSSYGITSLCEKGLIESCGRLDVPGRPLLYRTTPDFLRVFGMESLEELPVIDLPGKAKEQKDVTEVQNTEPTSEMDPLQEVLPMQDTDEEIDTMAFDIEEDVTDAEN